MHEHDQEDAEETARLPIAVPEPPNTDVPPTTTAVIEAKVKVDPACGSPDPIREATMSSRAGRADPAKDFPRAVDLPDRQPDRRQRLPASADGVDASAEAPAN